MTMATPKFLIKKGEIVTDVQAQWGIVVTDFPFLSINTKPKNIATRSYYDENGDYEYIPEVITYEPQEFTIKFAYKGAKDSAGTAIGSFINYISAEISLYSEHAGIGRQSCRIVSIDEPDRFYRTATKDVLSFSIRFKSNDPVTNVILSL